MTDFDEIDEEFEPDSEDIKQAQERAANIADYKAGAISLETLMSRNGVEDTDAEISRMDGDGSVRIAFLDRAADVVNKLADVLPLSKRLELLGFEETERTQIMKDLAKENPIIDAAFNAPSVNANATQVSGIA